jgi:hypothetical protein
MAQGLCGCGSGNGSQMSLRVLFPIGDSERAF